MINLNTFSLSCENIIYIKIFIYKALIVMNTQYSNECYMTKLVMTKCEKHDDEKK